MDCYEKEFIDDSLLEYHHRPGGKRGGERRGGGGSGDLFGVKRRKRPRRSLLVESSGSEEEETAVVNLGTLSSPSTTSGRLPNKRTPVSIKPSRNQEKNEWGGGSGGGGGGGERRYLFGVKSRRRTRKSVVDSSDSGEVAPSPLFCSPSSSATRKSPNGNTLSRTPRNVLSSTSSGSADDEQPNTSRYSKAVFPDHSSSEEGVLVVDCTGNTSMSSGGRVVQAPESDEDGATPTR